MFNTADIARRRGGKHLDINKEALLAKQLILCSTTGGLRSDSMVFDSQEERQKKSIQAMALFLLSILFVAFIVGMQKNIQSVPALCAR